MRSSAIVLGLALLSPLAFAGAASAQTTPSDVRDLIGARGSSGENALTTRGYVNVGSEAGDDRRWTYWWNERRGVRRERRDDPSRRRPLMSRRVARDHDRHAEVGRVVEQPGELQRQVHAAMAFREARQPASMQRHAVPGQALHVEHRRVVIGGRMVPGVLLKDREVLRL